MSYPYPLSSLPSADVPVNSIGPYHLSDPHSQPSLAGSPSPNQPWDETLSSKPKAKRSMSTPNTQTHPSADAASLALSGEKRRNKLGYHRTSVACGHCRRRKIRCIPAPGDPQKRCTNCIRLKKECNFYPVDQQPPPPGGKLSKDGKELGMVQADSVPSSPSLQHALPVGHHPFASLGLAGVGELGEAAQGKRGSSFSPDNKASFSRPLEYSSSSAWISSEPSPLSKNPPDMQSTYWRLNHQESPLTPAFSPFGAPINAQSQGTWPMSHADQSPQDDLGWGVPPQRSMSYGNVEGLASSHPHYSSFHQVPPQLTARSDYVPRTLSDQSGMYTPSLATPNSAMSGPEGSVPNDLSQNSTTPLSSGFPTPQNWSSSFQYQKPAAIPQNEAYTGWYDPTTAVGSVPGGMANSEAAYPSDQEATLFYPGTTQPRR